MNRGTAPPPSGIVAFLFSDVEGSTNLWERDPDAMAASLELHDRIMQSVVDSHAGYTFTTAGDSFAVAFHRSSAAVSAAGAIQQELAGADWPGPGLRVRLGLHVGEAFERNGDYFGPTVNTAARIEAAAHGGQTLMSRALAEAAGAVGEDLGLHRFRGVAQPMGLRQLGDGGFPPPRTLVDVRHNLSPLRQTLIGRESTVTELVSDLDAHRLVTLVAEGGCGKTSVARVVAQRELTTRKQVWFIDLTGVAAGGTISQPLAEVIGLSLDPERPHGNVADYLSGEPILLILDNCEHVIADTRQLIDALLDFAPDVTILATSRERLQIQGERVRFLDGLPSDENAYPRQLFIDRANTVRSSVGFDELELTAIDQLCERLHGNPLSIELAAARTTTLAPLDLLDLLNRRLDLLVSETDAHDRHRSLQATIQWSHDLLSEDERLLFRCFGLFVEPASPDLVSAVSGSTDIETLRLLGQLVNRSLVRPVRTDRRSRFGMLESTRAFAGSTLDRGPDRVMLRGRLGQWIEERLDGLPQGSAPDARVVDLLGADRATVLAHIDAIEAGAAAPDAARLLGACGYLLHEHPMEAIERSRRLQLATIGDPGVSLQLRTLEWLSHVQLSDYAGAWECAVRLQEDSDSDASAIGRCLHAFAAPDTRWEELLREGEAIEETEELRHRGDVSAIRHGILGVNRLGRSDIAGALPELRRSIELHSAADTLPELVLHVHRELAGALLLSGEPLLALAQLEAAEALPAVFSAALDVRAIAHLEMGDDETARALCRVLTEDALSGRLRQLIGTASVATAALLMHDGHNERAANLILSASRPRSPSGIALMSRTVERLGVRDAFTEHSRLLAQEERQFGVRVWESQGWTELRAEAERQGWNLQNYRSM